MKMNMKQLLHRERNSEKKLCERTVYFVSTDSQLKK